MSWVQALNGTPGSELNQNLNENGDRVDYLDFEYLSLLDGLSDLLKTSPVASSSRIILAAAAGALEGSTGPDWEDGSSLCPENR